MKALRSIADAPLRVLAGVERAMRNLDDIATGVMAMHRQLAAMRKDIRALDRRVDALRGEVADITGSVGGIRAATETIDHRVERLDASLESVDALAARRGRLGRPRRVRGEASRPS